MKIDLPQKVIEYRYESVETIEGSQVSSYRTETRFEKSHLRLIVRRLGPFQSEHSQLHTDRVCGKP